MEPQHHDTLRFIVTSVMLSYLPMNFSSIVTFPLQKYVHTVINTRAVPISMRPFTHTLFLLLYPLLFHHIRIRPRRPLASNVHLIVERQSRGRRPQLARVYRGDLNCPSRRAWQDYIGVGGCSS